MWNLIKFIQVIYIWNTNCVPNIIILAKNGYPDILFTMSFMAKMLKSENGHNSVKYSQNFMKSESGHHVPKQYAWYKDPRSQIFCWRDLLWEDPLWVKCLSLKEGNNSVKYSQNFMKSQSGNLHHVLKLYAWYHVHSSSGSPAILLTRLLYNTNCQSRRREIIQPNIYRILPNVNQVIYTLDIICMPNIKWFCRYFVDNVLYGLNA